MISSLHLHYEKMHSKLKPTDMERAVTNTLKRNDILALRHSAGTRLIDNQNLLQRLAENRLLKYRGKRGGIHLHHHTLAPELKNSRNCIYKDQSQYLTDDEYYPIQVLNRQRYHKSPKFIRQTPGNLIYPPISNRIKERNSIIVNSSHPSILLLNPTSIGKPHALQHLSADIIAFKPDSNY